MCFRSEFLHEKSHLRKISAVGIKMPWPFWNRDVYLQVTGRPIPDGKGGVLISLRSVDDGDFFGYKIEKDKDCAEMIVYYMAFYIEIVNDNKHIIRLYSNMDP